jgi:hypothetical protein
MTGTVPEPNAMGMNIFYSYSKTDLKLRYGRIWKLSRYSGVPRGFK